MIRLVNKKLIIPRGDTGSFSIPALYSSENSNVAIFTIIDLRTNSNVKSIICEKSNDILTVNFTHEDTVNLPVGKFYWDIKYYENPVYIEEEIISGTQVDSYYAAYDLPVCEIKQTGDKLITSSDSPEDKVDANVINIFNAKINEVREVASTSSQQVCETINNTVEAKLIELHNKGVEIKNSIPDDYTTLSNKVNNIDTNLMSYPHSTNWLNPNTILINTQINTNGVEEPYTDRCSSSWIPAKTGDTVYFAGISENGTMLSLTGIQLVRIAWYDENKTFIGQATWQQACELTAENIAYIRVTYSNTGALATAQLLAIMFVEPQSINDIEKYYQNGYKVIDLVKRSSSKRIIPDNFIDAWGDSRIKNGDGVTSIDKYLSNMLHSYRANHGYNGQGSGQIAIKMAAIDCYVTIENNQIISGDNILTHVFVNRGAQLTNVMQNSSNAEDGVPCSINGIQGYFWNYQGNFKFTTKNNLANPVPVLGYNKITVSPTLMYRYIIIWAGKNDFINYQTNGFVAYLADTISAMTQQIPHNQFVILGETTSSTDGYKYGGAIRTVMDNYNKLMARRFPDNFINIQQQLMSRGLEMAQITPTEDDIQALADGLLPPSLMSDNVHQNAICRQVIANIIYQFMANKGWVQE